MWADIFEGTALPFIGTALGSACVFFMKSEPGGRIRQALTGFAGGLMTAASVWSLLLPALQQSEQYGKLSFLPAVSGFWLGMLFLLLLDRIMPVPDRYAEKSRGARSHAAGTAVMALAVTLHNIPEGMAVGAVYAGLLSGSADITAGGALALALGIAIQNFPEGAIISIPLHAAGKTKRRSFTLGVLSGAVEPVFSLLTVLFAGLFVPVMPYMLSFAAGAMICVVVRDLIPGVSGEDDPYTGAVSFCLGFTLMMALDVALG